MAAARLSLHDTGGLAASGVLEDSGELADAEDMQSEEEDEEDADKAAADRRGGATPASARLADASASDSDPDAGVDPISTPLKAIRAAPPAEIQANVGM